MAHVSTNTASVAQLNSGIDAVTTTIVLSGPTFSGWPSTYPYWAIIARGTAVAEVVEVTAGTGATLTATRGRDGTVAAPHNAGDTFEHIAPADTFNRAEQHIDASAAHGATGAVVGTTNAQTLTQKLFQGGHKHVFTDSQPAGLTAGYESVADNASARDGFVHRNTAGDVDRRGFLLEQSGTPRVEVYNDGTVKTTPSGAATRKGFETTTSLKCGTTLEVGGVSTLTGNSTVGGTLGVTGATTLSTLGTSGNATVGGTLGVTGTSTLGVVNSGNHAVTGTLSASGATTLAAVSASGVVTASAGVKSFGSSLFDIPAVSSLPGSPATNMVVWLSTNKLFHRYNGSAWEIVAVVPHAQFRQSTAQTGIADNTWTNVNLNTEDSDDIASHDTVTNNPLFVAPYAGWYEFSGGITMEANTAGRREARWFKNQTTAVNASHAMMYASSQFTPISLTAKTIQISLAVNDNIALQVLQTSGISLNMVVNVEQASSMSVKYLGV